MPQELHVVRCYACKTFQVQIVKKVPKWQCKLCNEKQSILKVYARGSGKDCRQYVQDLNMNQGLLMSQETLDNRSLSAVEVQQHPDENQQYSGQDHLCDLANLAPSNKGSKWDEYLENESSKTDFRQKSDSWEEDQVEDLDIHDSEIQLFQSKKRKLNHHVSHTNADDFSYAGSSQPASQSFSSSGPSSSDILKSVNVNQRSRNFQNTSHTSVASSSRSSKWSQFISQSDENRPASPSEENRPASPSEVNLESSFETTEDSNLFNTKSYHSISPIISAGRNTHNTSNQSESASVSNKCYLTKKLEPKISAAGKNPFFTIDDDDLDSLLDF